jgi:hypothetical protein
MTAKRFLWYFCIVAIVGGIALLTAGVIPARAQCGEPQYPLCVNCHAKQNQESVPEEWHSTHLLKATCVNCHGGNGFAAEKDPAHVGMVANPLTDIYTSCRQCHPENYQTAAAGYATTLNVTPASCTTPTPVPLSGVSGEPLAGNFSLPSASTNTTIQGQSIMLTAGGLAMMIFFLVGLSWLGRHRLGN